MSRPHCDSPASCEVRGGGHCRRCNLYRVLEIKRARLLASTGLHESELEAWRIYRANNYSRDEAARAVIANRQAVAA